MQISQVHLLYASRQVHLHGNTRIWLGENMQKIGGAVFQKSEIYPGYAGVLIVQSPHLLIYTFTFRIMSVGIKFVYFFVNI